jgi:ankyrin repeat protein
VETSHPDLTKLLISRGASIAGALSAAVAHHTDPSTVQLLLDQGATDPDSHALVRAASLNKVEMAKILLSHENAPVRPSPSFSNALTEASSRGHLEMVQLLLVKHSFPINGLDTQGRTALSAACSADYPSAHLVQTLLDHGADVASPTGDTPRKPSLLFPQLTLSRAINYR